MVADQCWLPGWLYNPQLAKLVSVEWQGTDDQNVKGGDFTDFGLFLLTTNTMFWHGQ